MSNKLNVSLNSSNNKLIGSIESKNEINVNIIGTGARGKDGMSAYEVWLAQGNEGTIEDFFKSIQGETLHVDAITTTDDKQFISWEEKLRLSGFTHDQIESASTWIVDHTLSKFPSVTVVDSGGSLVMGSLEYVSENQLIISFTHEFSGKAFLN